MENRIEEIEKLKHLLQFSIIIIDKPAGPTSFSVSDSVRRELKEFSIAKTSHFGTLDPQVTGVLPVALGRACKLTGMFLGHDKKYTGKMHLHKEISLKELQKVIDKEFTGIITQLPPKKSRVKRQLREREIISFKLIKQEEKDFYFETEVQGGTYIRKLVHDLGEKTGLGAHMTELRRTRAGIFDDSSLHTLEELRISVREAKEGSTDKLKNLLIPAEEAIKQVFPFVELDKSKKELVKKLLTGKPIFKGDFPLPDGDVFAVFFTNRFIEIAKKVEEQDGIIARPEFVYN